MLIVYFTRPIHKVSTRAAMCPADTTWPRTVLMSPDFRLPQIVANSHTVISAMSNHEVILLKRETRHGSFAPGLTSDSLC